jgi:chemotaxis protein methyltransferase CheR
MVETNVACDYGTLSEDNFKFIKSLLYDTAGINIPDHKQQMVFNRITKRIQGLDIKSFNDYIQYVEKNEDEIINLINALTTNVTHFFRESHHFDHLKNEIQSLINNGQKRIRIWSAGCSIGAEPYSSAMTIDNILPNQSGIDIKILATDIDTNALAFARKAIYAERLLKGLPKVYLTKYFDKVEADEPSIKIKEKLRKIVYFNHLNLNLKDWPMTGPFDIIFCRNVLIYFDKAKQQEYVSKMIHLLKDNGYLYLGHSENSVMADRNLKICGPTIYKKEQ